MKANFLQDGSGSYSSSRLIGIVIVIAGLLMTEQIILMGTPENIIGTAGAAGILFGAVSGSAMVFLFKQKETEVKQEIEDKKIEAETK